MSQLTKIVQTSTRGTGTTTSNTQTVTHGKTDTQVEGERTSTDTQGAASGSRVSALTGQDDAGFSISFSIAIRGGLNAGSSSPQDL